MNFRLILLIVRWLSIFLFTILLFLVKAKNVSSAHPIVWVTDSMERIGLDESPTNKKTIELYAARGEYESFQIGICLPKHSTKVFSIRLSDLEDFNGNRISHQNIELYREHYIQVKHHSPVRVTNTNKPLEAGWYPDALIPYFERNTDKLINNTQKNTNQVFWLDIYVPRNTSSGKYRGKFTVSSDLGKTEGEIYLTVWDFELPLQPTLDSAVLLWESKSKEDFIELLKHKIMPVADIEPKLQQELIEQWGLKSLRLPFWSGANYQNCSMKPSPSIEEIQAAAKFNQPSLSQYVYPTDEIDRCTNLYQSLKQWGKNIHQAGFKHLAVMAPVPELYETIDIWVVDPQRYNTSRNLILEVLAQAKAVWFYTTLDPEGYSPKWAIDYAPINYRIPHGFINQTLGLTGMLYWRADLWSDDPWHNVETYTQKDGRNYPGEGMLVYPGETVGISHILPSMRLKWIRDGVEDYEYIEILKQLGKKDLALKISHAIAPDWYHWTRDTQKLALARQALGNQINLISKKQKLALVPK